MIRRTLLNCAGTAVACLFSLEANAQFYPADNATWCAWSQFARYNFRLPEQADTVMNGQTYQRVQECYHDYENNPWLPFWNEGRVHFIRSAPDGKGYIYIPDSLTEYLIGDLAAAPGDTVNDVMIWRVGDWNYPYLFDVVVDSVVDVTNAGVTVTRHFVHELNAWNSTVAPSDFAPWRFFWQAGMGTSHGLVLNMEGGISRYELSCAMTGDSTVYGPYFTGPDIPPWGYPPSGPPCCDILNVGVAELGVHSENGAYPNPSHGFFQLEALPTSPLTVLDMHGREVLRLPPYSRETDLSAQPPGVYTAIVQSPQSRSVQRLVVVK